MRRREFLGEFLGLAGATLVAGLSTKAASQAVGWPERPVKLILPYAPGGASDLIGRPWADKLSQAFGQQFVIENRGGASGIIGTEAVARSAPDGYTFLLTPSAPLTVQPILRKTPYEPFKSFAPVGRVGDHHQRLCDSSSRWRQDLQGDDRLRQGQPRQARLRLRGTWNLLAPAHRDAEGEGRHRRAARALPR